MNRRTAMRLSLLIEVTKQHVQAIKARPRRDRQAENRLTNSLQSLWDDLVDDLFRRFEDIGHVPGDVITQGELAHMFGDLLEPFVESIVAESIDSAEFGFQRAAEEIRREGGEIAVTFDEVAAGLEERIREGVFEASQRTLNRVTGNVLDNLAESAREGVGIDEAARNLRKVLNNMRGFELERVARTEIQSAQNEGAHEAIEALGVTYEQWISADDDRTRDSHLELHGQIVATGEVFSNGLLFPGDRSGPIEEWINCRCRTRPFLMPEGKIPPVDQPWFYEDDLVDIAA